MFNTEDYSDFFDNFIMADANPFELNYTETYKENGQLKSQDFSKTIQLEEVSTPIDLILRNNNVEVIDFYPKSFLQRIFKRKGKINLDYSNEHFVFMSKKTCDLLKHTGKVYDIHEDDKIVIGKKGTLITLINGDKIWAYTDINNYKTILIR